MSKLKIDKIIVLMLVFTFAFSPIFNRKAEAQWVDWANLIPNTVSGIGTWAGFLKDYALDAVAYQVINLIIERMAASTVKWINTGFKGSPAFVTNPEAYFRAVGDQAAGEFIFKNENLNFLCSPIRSKIKLALTTSYTRGNSTYQCTLTDAIGNMEDFLDDFDKGGWDKFFELSQRQQNSPIGAYLLAESDLYTQIANKLELRNTELSWGKGFLSYQECTRYDNTVVTGGSDVATDPVTGDPSEVNFSDYQVPSCSQWRTTTPGSTIENRLNEALSLGEGRIQVADEINEIMGALLNQLASKALGGLSKLSKPDPSDGNKVFLDQFTSQAKDNKINQYFDSSAQSVNSTLNTPTPELTRCQDNPNDPVCKNGGGSGGGNGGGGVRPTDNDCNNVDYSLLSQIAQGMADASNGMISFNEAMQTMDCDPQGIN